MDHSKIRILLVDDEPAVCQSLAGFLEDFNFPVDSAQSAEEVLQKLEEKTYDVMVVDLRLPCMSGETLILRVHEMNPKIRFIVNTGSAEYLLSEELKKIGMKSQDVLLKPLVDMQALIAAIENVVGDKD